MAGVRGMKWGIQHKRIQFAKPAFRIDKKLQNKLDRITKASAKYQMKLF